jgi:hypothetical protein
MHQALRCPKVSLLSVLVGAAAMCVLAFIKF